ncbi:hypothetical protein ACUN7V_16915 [Quadrisphaera oryzae]|uniref:hypothetical protein n=1 Tax=Quadrisphaera TaxID=317661 RepID=UPI0016446FC4|nr:hypothetical protein [Quadrisphaera sp. RL12-1S]MBC3761212.1 hypothetical protein [Quadrisphaera sp. RL12-1S]
MLDSPTGGPAPSAGSPQDDDERDEVAAAAPLDAVRAVVGELDRACDGPDGGPDAGADGGPDGGAARWEALVVALQRTAAEVARRDAVAWRLAAGSGVPLEHWLRGAWAARLRCALLADGFGRAGADQALGVVAVHLARTCPSTGPGTQQGSGGPADAAVLPAYPVLSRLRQQLSADASDVGGALDAAEPATGALLARVAALRG